MAQARWLIIACLGWAAVGSAMAADCAMLQPNADLSGCDYSRQSLAGKDLRGVHLSGATLRFADFSGADLQGADFAHSDVWNASFDKTRNRPPSLTEALAEIFTGSAKP